MNFVSYVGIICLSHVSKDIAVPCCGFGRSQKVLRSREIISVS